MKHLKPFNESKVSRDDLQEFCEHRLAYLLDEGYSFNIYDIYTTSADIPAYIIWLSKFYNSKYNEFQWNEIKEYYITFLTQLDKYYDVMGRGSYNKSIVINLPDNQSKEFKFEDFINDNFDTNINLTSIGVRIKN